MPEPPPQHEQSAQSAASGEPGGPSGPGASPAPSPRPRRHALWLLLVPAALYCAAPLVANRIEPRVLGVPFLLAWIIAATVLSPLVIWLAARLDPAYREGADEPLPGVDAPTADADSRDADPRGGAR
ncbi:DUF3311 domain-containing protein [Streptomyces sp. ODS28]|uniref:DUF3311 domain-containing protein n=1 Tax=Streptomyces sp. ODS28 TaxID=3136688 RepID=UPI0031EF6481